MLSIANRSKQILDRGNFDPSLNCTPEQVAVHMCVVNVMRKHPQAKKAKSCDHVAIYRICSHDAICTMKDVIHSACVKSLIAFTFL